MKKKRIISFMLFLLLLISLFVPGCIFNKDNKDNELQNTSDINNDTENSKENSEIQYLKESNTNQTLKEEFESIESELNDFQVMACLSAHKYGTCERIPDLGLATIEECCEKLGKCCQDE